MFELAPQDLPGRLALVTGGTQGIGKEIARGLVRRGIEVIVAARDAASGAAAASELSAEGARATFHYLDLFDEGSIHALVRVVEERHGKLDILVNNAAFAHRPKSAFEVTAEEMRKVFEANVFAVVTITNAFLPLLDRSAAGRIVNVSSERGSLASPLAFATQPNMAYSTSKTALNAVTQHFAYQLTQRGSPIKVNAAAPGHCKTAFNGFRGHRTPEEGASIALTLALLDAGGPHGGFFTDEGPAPW